MTIRNILDDAILDWETGGCTASAVETLFGRYGWKLFLPTCPGTGYVLWAIDPQGEWQAMEIG